MDKRKLICVVMYLSLLFIQGIIEASTGPTMLEFSRRTNTDVAFLGILFSCRSFGFVTGSFSGPLYDKLPGHILLGASVIGMALCAFALTLVQTFPMLLLFFYLTGITLGGINTGTNVLLLRLFRESGGGEPFMQALHFCFGVGATVSPLYFGMIMDAHQDNFNLGFYIFSIACIPFIIAIFITPSPPIPKTDVVTKDSDTKKSSKKKACQCSSLEFLVILHVGIFLGLIGGVESSTGGYLETFIVKMGIGSESTGYQVTFAFWLSFTIGRAIAIPLSKFLSLKAMLFINLTGYLIMIVITLFVYKNVAILYVMAVLMGLFLASSYPTMFSFADSIISIEGSHASWILIGGSLGESLVPFSIGLSFDTRFGYISLFYGLVFYTILGYYFLILMTIYSRHPSSKLYTFGALGAKAKDDDEYK